MTEINQQRRFRQPAIYQIMIQGELDESWTDWLNGFVITNERDAYGVPISCLTGTIADQSALRGILTKIWDMNLTLLSVSRTHPRTRKAS
jgi:hypothetical protein